LLRIVLALVGSSIHTVIDLLAAGSKVEGMNVRRLDVFFYGLFMDADALRAKGLNPVNVRQAQVRGMALRIGKRAALAESPTSATYGVLMELTHAEIDKLYSEPSVEMYRPEAVRAELADGSIVAALCFNLVMPSPDEANPAYAASLRELARKLGLPVHYTEMLG
jgi:hypothetical protein